MSGSAPRSQRRRGRPEAAQSEPTRLSDLASEVLGWMAGPERGELLEVLRVWDGSVGERIALAARPRRLKDGILTVDVSSPVWAQELALLAPTIVEALNADLGRETVRELRFSPESGRREGGRK